MCKILYVDRETDHAVFFKKVCEKNNIDCDIADSYDEAVPKLRNNNDYDMVLTALNLINHSGTDLIDSFPNEKWFVVTSLPEDMISKNVLEDKRITKILYKPISVTDMLDVFNKYIKVYNKVSL